MKTISIFGSTGTIGVKALEIAINNGFEIVAITGNNNHKKLIEQAKLCNPKYVCVSDKNAFEIVKNALDLTNIQIVPHSEIDNIAKIEVDCFVMAIAGNAGLSPAFSCLGHTKRLAIATKEVIISGGNFLMKFARQKKTEIIPIDSEHNAIFQCLLGEDKNSVSEIILTASGGAFVNFEKSDLDNVAVNDALKHPNWIMGQKITIDSATLINKALEMIEAAYLFDIDIEKIKPLIHTDSIIHGLVKFIDNSFKLAVSFPDMRLPISYALNYPKRIACDLKNLDFEKIGSLKFKELKNWQKRNINLAYDSFKENKVIAFNRANEIAVNYFLNGKLKFKEIYNFISKTLEISKSEKVNSINDIFSTIESIDNICSGFLRF